MAVATAPSKLETLEKARGGDQHAFSLLLRQHDERMRALAWKLLGDRDRMDDALQEAYVKAWRSLGGFREDADFGTWLYRITYNACMDELRRSRPTVAAAALVAVAGIAAVTRSDDTKLETTPAAPVVTVETTTPPPTTSVVPPEPTSVPRTASTVPVAPGTSKPSVSPTTVPRSTTTTRPGTLTLSPAGLGPLRLGMSPQQAAATGAMGRYRDADPTSPGSCGTAPPAGSYRSGDFTGLFVDNKLVRFYVTASSRLSTPQGISVGSPSSMIASVPGTRSEQPEPYGAGTNITVMTGGAGYQFTVSQGAITEWSVGTPAGLDLKEACS